MPLVVMLSLPCTLPEPKKCAHSTQTQFRNAERRSARQGQMILLSTGASSWLAEIVAQLAEQGNAFMLSFDQHSTGLRTPSGLKLIQ